MLCVSYIQYSWKKENAWKIKFSQKKKNPTKTQIIWNSIFLILKKQSSRTNPFSTDL